MAAPMRIFRTVSRALHCLRLQNTTNSRCGCIPAFKHERLISNTYVLFNNDNLSVKKKMEILTDKFSEARELLGDARESMGTVYFSEDMEEAQQAVNETLEEYRTFLDSLSDKEKQNVISTIGLRMEELKAQKAALEETLKD